MLDRLLESKQTRERARGSAIVSITAHTALIAAAVYATAQARVQPTRLSYVVPADYFPRISHATQRTQITAPRPKPIDGQRPIYVEPTLATKFISIDVTGVLSKPSDFGAARISSGGSIGTSDSASGSSGEPLSAEQVEKQVAVIAGNAPPRYPEALRQAGVEGRVIAEFVVNELGRTEEASIRFVQSDNHLFEDAVRLALRRMRFIPAEVGARKVRQLVEMPFVFTLAR